MIAHKIGRILAGDPSFQDHWADIAGYATLIINPLRSKAPTDGNCLGVDQPPPAAPEASSTFEDWEI